MTIPKFHCDDITPKIDNDRGTSNYSDKGGRRESNNDRSERHVSSMDSATDMNRSEGSFVSSRTIMQRKISQKNKFFKRYGIVPHTASTEKNKQNSMTWRHQPMNKSTAWFKGMKKSKPVDWLVTLKNSSIGIVRSGRDSSDEYTKMLEHENSRGPE
ncbi:hypothetical protein SBOR_4514 [Sclerotinia borealis F-4128]|uniref:Uncharacterized protein n=1 Tax=Sclerotinia borealis (strain F-4128) TaxID=1432307 RepID=W9CGM2_SCLBF|nr:hypothetical protein SBOR_4514 [Sclerotinia borealis F-4128]